jgi:hypothetical protein
VLDSDPKTSLAKSPNAQLVALYTTRQADFSSGQAEVDGNYKSQNPNNKQIKMTEIVRASLGLPTLRAGPQFQNSKCQHHPTKKNSKNVWVIEYWNLRFICNLVLGIWDFGMRNGKCQMSNVR